MNFQPQFFRCSELMHEIVTFAERVPKLVNGTAWKKAEIKRYDCTLLFKLCNLHSAEFTKVLDSVCSNFTGGSLSTAVASVFPRNVVK